MTPDARPAGGRRINELMGPNWWRTEAILAARLRDLVAGLDSIGAFTIPYARLPRRLATYADEFPRWADVADQTPQALLLRPKLGASAVEALIEAARDAVRINQDAIAAGKVGLRLLSHAWLASSTTLTGRSCQRGYGRHTRSRSAYSLSDSA
jgi:hypothetical protein